MLGLLLSNCYCPFLNCYCPTSPHIFNYIWSYRSLFQARLSCWKVKTRGYKFSVGRRTQFCPQDIQNGSSTNIGLLLSKNWNVTVWPLLIILTISRVIKLCFKWDWSCWKVKTRDYKFSVGRRTHFYLDSSTFPFTHNIHNLTFSHFDTIKHT